MNRLLALSLLVILLISAAAPALAAPTADFTYVVQRGDTLFSLALRFGTTVQAIMQANSLTSSLIFVGQRLTIPTGTTAGSGTSTGGTTSGGSAGPCGRTYTVQRGETLKIIAAKCGTTFTAIAALNGLTNPDLIFVGQVLKLPTVPGAPTGPTSPISNPPPPTSPPPPSSPGGTSPCPVIYTVQRGDTLRIIATKCGVTPQAILANNVLPNPNLIFVGQQLSIPGGVGSGSGTGATPPPAATPAAPPPTTSRGLTGQLTLCNPEKPSFAARIERICFREIVFNPTGAPVSYGVLGVQATNLLGSPNQFQTSWRGDLSVPPGGQGPVGGGWEDGIYIETPGTYRLQLAICYLNVDACMAGSGWELLTSGVDVKVVNWTP